MEPVWVIIVILYLLFTALGRSARRPVRRPPGPEPDTGQTDRLPGPWPQEPAMPGGDQFEDAELGGGHETERAARPRPRPRPQQAAPVKTLEAPAVVLRRRHRRTHVPQTRTQWAAAVIASELLQSPRVFRPYRIPRR